MGKVTTDAKGEAMFERLYQGKYKLVETETNKDYILDETEKEINIFYNQLTTKEITNKHKEANLKDGILIVTKTQLK